MPIEFTIDDFLGGKIRLKQSIAGYRATSDAVLLASSLTGVPDNAQVLDVGAGTGAVALCVAVRFPKVVITGLELQEEMLTFAIENAKLNNMTNRVSFIKADISRPIPEIKEKQFDFVITNPPFMKENVLCETSLKDVAHRESAVPLADWITFCIKKLKPKGVLSLIIRADRLPEVLNVVCAKLGNVKLIPLWPMLGKSPKRIIIQGTKNSRAPLTILSGVVLHNSDGSETEIARKIMREGASLF